MRTVFWYGGKGRGFGATGSVLIFSVVAIAGAVVVDCGRYAWYKYKEYDKKKS